jgi:hypothetical protein
MRWRLLAGTVSVALFPYLTQSSSYVTLQYIVWRESMHAVVELERTVAFAQIFRVLEIVNRTVPPHMQTIVRLGAAGGLLGLMWLVRRRIPVARYGIYLFTLTTAYVLLLNPRTENNGYAFLSPAIGLFLAEAFLVERNWPRGVIFSVIAAGTLGGYELAVLIAPDVPPIWLAPLMAIGFLAVTAVCLHRELKQGRRPSGQFDRAGVDSDDGNANSPRLAA